MLNLDTIEQRIQQRRAVDPDDAEDLIREIRILRQALAWYTDATTVLSYSYEQDQDNGELARKVLGYGSHDPACQWPNDSEVCTCGLQDRIRADFPQPDVVL